MNLQEELIRCRDWIQSALDKGGDKGHGIGQLTDMNDDAIAWAKAQGCDGMTISGRKGWQRVLESEGWKQQFTTLVKEF